MTAAVNAPYHLLADLAPDLWQSALVCSSGTSLRRLPDLALWDASLQAGHLPALSCDWGDADACLALRTEIESLDLAALTRDSAAMAHQVLRVMLWHLDRLIDRPAVQSRAEAIVAMVRDFRDEWSTQRADWEQLRALFRSLGDLAHMRWDTLQGHLQSRGWSEARRMGDLLDRLTGLGRFIDGVGRAQRGQTLPPATEISPQAAVDRVLAAVSIVTHLVDQPSEVRGVKRSGQLSRMLASEAAMVGHPLFQRLWRARFAEQQLLTYEDAAIIRQTQLRPDATRKLSTPTKQAPRGQGPMLVCLDTSGSMRGAPENVAKACVLQALRTAHAAGRPCRLMAFGSAGELLEQELSVSPQGLENLLALMDQSFDGGTDVQTPLERAVHQVQQLQFALADILIVSDGEFGVTPDTLQMLHRSKRQLGLRVHGILIGDRETIGLLEVCDQLHWVRDWRRYASASGDAYADGFSPVHSRSLTAMYFPNAMRRDPAPGDTG